MTQVGGHGSGVSPMSMAGQVCAYLLENFLFADKHPWAKYWALCEKSVGKFERVK